MTAQNTMSKDKSEKNAKARRAKKKDSPSESKGSGSVRAERGGATVSGPKGSIPERIVKFWKGVVAETKRVSWPSKPELVAGTITTVFILMIFAGWLGGLELLLRRLLGQ